jgi:hypothetical protein
MEGLGAAASVAGLASLAAQTISGMTTLRDFYKDMVSSSKTVNQFLHEINAIIKTMSQVEELCTQPSNSDNENVRFAAAALKISMEDCSKDVYIWLKEARNLHIGDAKGTRATFKKFWVAINKSNVKDVRQQVSSHRLNINTGLSMLGRYGFFCY